MQALARSSGPVPLPARTSAKGPAQVRSRGLAAAVGDAPDGIPTGTGTGTFTWAGTAVGARDPEGAGTGSFTWAGAAVGDAPGGGPPNEGSAAGSFNWTGAAFGDNGDATTVTCLTQREVGIVPSIELVPAAELPEAEPILRVSHQMPVLSAANPAYTARIDYDVVKEVVGYVHLWINQQDVTYFRDSPTIIRRWESEAPFGDTVAAFEFPQLNPWDKPGEGDLSFLYPDAPVRIGIVDDEGVVRIVWRGFLDARGNGTAGQREDYSWEAKGLLWQAQHRNREPYPYTEPMDLGVLLARVLNAVEGRRWRTLPWTPIGIKTLTRGSRDDTAWEFTQALLSEAITDDGDQWTLAEVPGVGFRLVLKPPSSEVDATFAYGTPGIDCDLRIDESTRIDRIFARGIGARGGGWANVFFPGLELLNAPPYPNSSPTNYLELGDTDGDTDSGDGVSVFQRRVADINGFANPAVSGVMSSAWMAIIDDLQRTLGVTADGSVGPQTWNALFDHGVTADSEALKPRRLPVASKPWANKYLYSASGVQLGVNPQWTGVNVIRDIGIDLGPGKTKAQGRKLARALLSKYGEAGAYGTVRFAFDPNGTDRTRLSHLSNIEVLGHESTDRVLQASSKVVELDTGSEDGALYVVTMRLDEHQRDAMYVEDLLRAAQVGSG